MQSQYTRNVDLFFLIICGIRKHTRIETPRDVVTALYNNSVAICIQEFIIKDYHPLGLVHFLMTVCHESTVGSLTTSVFHREGFEAIRELLLEEMNEQVRSRQK